MRSSIVLIVFFILWSIAYFLLPFFYPGPAAPNIYNTPPTSIGAFVFVLALSWPRFKPFLRAPPIAFRLLFGGFLALLAFMDIKTSGFTPFTSFALTFAIMWGILMVTGFK